MIRTEQNTLFWESITPTVYVIKDSKVKGTNKTAFRFRFTH